MTRLSTTFSAWLNIAWERIIGRDTRSYFLISVVLTLLIAVGLALIRAYIIKDMPLSLFLLLLLSPILVTLVFLTIHVARLTRDPTKDTSAKVWRLWLEFALVFVFGLVIAAIQYEQQGRIDNRQSKLQEEITARSDYFNAISQLGSLSPVVRISGIDYLIETCMGEKKELHPDKCSKDDTITLFRDQVRFFTQSKSYQEDFEEEPSGDIAKIIEILKRVQGLSNIVWDGVYLRGADLHGANLQGADLRKADLQEADLDKTNLQKANLYMAKLQGAYLWEANLQGAHLREANLQGAELWETKLQGADLREAHLQGANLYGAHLQEADLYMANLQGAYSEDEDLSVDFCTRIINRMGKPTEIEGKDILFSGGITKELWEEMEKTQWHDEEAKKDFLSKMKSHLNKEPVYTIPDEFKNTVNTGELTEETAAAIIKEYNESLTDEQARCELPQ